MYLLLLLLPSTSSTQVGLGEKVSLEMEERGALMRWRDDSKYGKEIRCLTFSQFFFFLVFFSFFQREKKTFFLVDLPRSSISGLWKVSGRGGKPWEGERKREARVKKEVHLFMGEGGEFLQFCMHQKFSPTPNPSQKKTLFFVTQQKIRTKRKPNLKAFNPPRLKKNSGSFVWLPLFVSWKDLGKKKIKINGLKNNSLIRSSRSQKRRVTGRGKKKERKGLPKKKKREKSHFFLYICI